MARTSRDGARLAAIVAVGTLLAGCGPGASQGTATQLGPAAPVVPWSELGSAVVPARPSPTPALPPGPVPTPPVPLTPAPAPSPSPSTTSVLGPCLPLYGPGTSVPVNVTSTGGRAVITWFHNGDLATTAYWVGAQSLTGTAAERSAVRWTKVAPPVGCTDVTVTVPGLRPSVPYVLWLDADSITPETGSGTTRHTLNHVGRVIV